MGAAARGTNGLSPGKKRLKVRQRQVIEITAPLNPGTPTEGCVLCKPASKACALALLGVSGK